MTKMAFLLLPLLGLYAGGWAVVTVDDLPDYVVAGQPVTVSFMVRQHGRTLLEGLKPEVRAAAGERQTSATVAPGNGAGRYTATLTLPQPGEWAITINSGFMESRVTLLPIRAIAVGGRAPLPLADADRGRRLFVAKGCVTCHVHGDVTAARSLSVGPELTGRRYAADYLSRFLANPALVAPVAAGTFQMPNLNLKEKEITALVAFINGEKQAL